MYSHPVQFTTFEIAVITVWLGVGVGGIIFHLFNKWIAYPRSLPALSAAVHKFLNNDERVQTISIKSGFKTVNIVLDKTQKCLFINNERMSPELFSYNLRSLERYVPATAYGSVGGQTVSVTIPGKGSFVGFGSQLAIDRLNWEFDEITFAHAYSERRHRVVGGDYSEVVVFSYRKWQEEEYDLVLALLKKIGDWCAQEVRAKLPSAAAAQPETSKATVANASERAPASSSADSGTKFCTVCGSKVSSSQKYCGSCGGAL